MSVKTDRPQVRTAQDLERKYNFYGIETNIKQNKEGLTKVSNELYQFANAVAGDTSILQRQLDGEIDTWYGDEVPTLLNKPVSSWSVEDYENHVDDLYYDRTTGKTYVFTENEGTFSWELTASTYLAEVLAIANKAQETADDKRAVFLNTTPVPPYASGDLWINNQKLYVCQIGREDGDVFDSNDFVIATNYVDGTDAKAIGDGLIEVYNGQVTKMIADNNKVVYDFITPKIDAVGDQVDEIHDYIKFEGSPVSIKLIAGNSVYSLKIESDRIQIYKNDTPISRWRQNEFAITKLFFTDTIQNTGTTSGFAFIPRNNGSLSFRKITTNNQ